MIERGDIYFVDLNPTKGREQAGRRPVLVVSSNAINRQPLVITVVVGTDSTNVRQNYPTNVRATAQETGLPRDTVFLCFQVRSLDPARFTRTTPDGKMPASRMAEVRNALRLALDL